MNSVLLGLAVILLAPLAVSAADLPRISGTVLDTNEDERVLKLEHQGVDGLLEPGVLEARVGRAELSVDYTGRTIDAALRRVGTQWWLENIWPGFSPESVSMTTLNDRLHAETATLGRRAARVSGDFLPNFALYNQEGSVVQLRQFRGQFVVVNFIFTRCPDPNMCPASTARMVDLQHLIKQEGWDGVHQVSITLDPGYDTPGILKSYAQSRGIDLEHFSLLTGPERVVRDLLKVFGVLTFDADGVLNHTMVTVLIDPNGKIVHRREGSRWTVKEFADKLQTHFSDAS